jgi:hypothetical protein
MESGHCSRPTVEIIRARLEGGEAETEAVTRLFGDSVMEPPSLLVSAFAERPFRAAPAPAIDNEVLTVNTTQFRVITN